MAVSGDDGKFKIENLPEGEWTFQLWQEKAGYLSKVKQNGKNTSWRFGRVKLKIASGKTTDLGEIRVPPSAFKK